MNVVLKNIFCCIVENKNMKTIEIIILIIAFIVLIILFYDMTLDPKRYENFVKTGNFKLPKMNEFIKINTNYCETKYKHVVLIDERKPYRVGKKQNRTVLDKYGHEVVVFSKKNKDYAQKFADYLNNNNA